MTYHILITDNDQELIPLASAINKKYCNGQAKVFMYNDPHLDQNTKSDALFLVGHASARGIGAYDAGDLFVHFNQHLYGATAVYLAGCSTNSQSAQILNNAFIPSTLAKSVKEKTKKDVYGTPGVLVLNLKTNALSIIPGSPIYKPDNIFIKA